MSASADGDRTDAGAGQTGPGRGDGTGGARRVPRLFPSDLPPGRRRVYGAVLAFYLAATAGLVWPIYAQFSGIRPLVLGMPLSLFYVVLWVVASFLVLLGLYLWEGRRGDDDGRARPPGSPRGEG